MATARRQDGPILYFASYAAGWWYTSSQVAPTANAEPQFCDLANERWPRHADKLWDEARFPNPLIG